MSLWTAVLVITWLTFVGWMLDEPAARRARRLRGFGKRKW